MKQRIFIIIAGAAILLIGVAFLLMPHGPEWTTDSPAALAEFEASWDATQKLYHQEAREHLEKALSLDPDFVMAKLRLAEMQRYLDAEKADELVAELHKVDAKKLKPREAFLLQRMLMIRDAKFKEAADALNAYYEKNRDDPQILYIKAMDEWQAGNLQPAEELFSRLLEIRPNWVIAYNQLGYISMIRGQFSKAEEYFSSYRFIAPDQANPHDSLGELYVLTGRWDEAELSFKKALEVKPEFAASMGHLSTLAGLRGHWDEAFGWIDQAESTGALREDAVEAYRCSLAFWKLAREEQWEALLQEAGASCDPKKNPMAQAATLLHEAACHVGRWDLAEAIEKEVESRLENESSFKGSSDFRRAMLNHLRGIRLSAQNEEEEAVTAFADADRELSYLNMEMGLFKLSNRLALAEALSAVGRDDEARAWIEKVRKVNVPLVEMWEAQRERE